MTINPKAIGATIQVSNLKRAMKRLERNMCGKPQKINSGPDDSLERSQLFANGYRRAIHDVFLYLEDRVKRNRRKAGGL